ncbi:MAG: hypothetical protein ACFFFH_19420 [Candidatus Thorarchaeota archaeon]
MFSQQTYYINGEPKLFYLDGKSHILYEANDEYADFGLGASIIHHPSPNFQFTVFSYNLTVAKSVEVKDFTINGESVVLNHTVGFLEDYSAFELPQGYYEGYILPNQGMDIDSEENVTFSCIVEAKQSLVADFYFWLNWSPDNSTRYTWWLWLNEDPIVINYAMTSATSTNTTTSTSTSTPIPGFSILSTLLLLPTIIVIAIRRRRY